MQIFAYTAEISLKVAGSYFFCVHTVHRYAGGWTLQGLDVFLPVVTYKTCWCTQVCWCWLIDVAGFWGSADMQEKWNIAGCNGENCESGGLLRGRSIHFLCMTPTHCRGHCLSICFVAYICGWIALSPVIILQTVFTVLWLQYVRVI